MSPTKSPLVSPTKPTSTLQGSSHWHTLEAEEVLDHLETSLTGLREDDAESRLKQYGKNELIDHGLKSSWRMLWEQATSGMILVLVAAALIQAVVAIHENEPREWIDVVAILTIVVLNIALGVFQEYRAEKAMAALKTISAPRTRVRRAGVILDIAARELVPGDIVMLEAGNIVPADCRLLECASLRTQESSLTGESLPVDKQVHVLDYPNILLGDRTNMLFMGTSVLNGRGIAVVVATGMNTQFGHIAGLIQNIENEKTPLQRRIEDLGVKLGFVVTFLVLTLFGLGLVHGQKPLHMFMSSVAVAVAAIPEGLPAVLTITLALGAQRMLERGALMRKLPAVETLGSVTVICTDKTGTLTENRMSVVAMNAGGHTTTFDGPTQQDNDTNTSNTVSRAVHARLNRDETILWVAGALCNDASLRGDYDAPEQLTGAGDPTEVAVLLRAADLGLSKSRLEEGFPRIAEASFSFQRKCMATLHRINERWTIPVAPDAWTASELILFVKGAPESVLEKSQLYLNNGSVTRLDDAARARICADNDALTSQGHRVLAVAYRAVDAVPESVESLERDLVFVGLLSLLDPPRPEAREAVEKCLLAGIRPVMITGDHPLTALEIARQLKITDSGSHTFLTGSDLSCLSPEEWDDVVERVPVYARVEPEQKLRIVEALQRHGHVVAMTGDGVNDAPTLRRANIGVAMGITGSDVAKEAADMVITDDNFATIVSAIEEGRTIYDNVRKFVKYIVSSNSAEVTVMLSAMLFGFPMPLTTLQILWINLVTDGVPGLALGLEPPEANVMGRSPVPPHENLFERGLVRHVLVMGLVLAVSCLGTGLWAYYAWGPNGPWQTMLFATLTFSQLCYVMNVRSNRTSLFQTGFGGNQLLLWSVLMGLLLQLCVVYWAPLQVVFSTQSLTPLQLAICLVASTVVCWPVELEKWLLRRQDHVPLSSGLRGETVRSGQP